MQKIVLATDFSERSDRALRRAVILARQTGASIDLVHVVDDDRPRRIVDRELADARALLFDYCRTLQDMDGVSGAIQVTLADPFEGIARLAAELSPDLLVIGPHRRQILRDAFVGTTAERTIRSVSCPALMVNGPPAGEWGRVLLTTDLSGNSRDALRRFASMGMIAEGGNSLLHVFDAPALRLATGTMAQEEREDYLVDLAAEAGRNLRAFMAGLGGLKADALVRHAETTVSDVILKAARELRADLIVISTQGKGAVGRMLLGSVAQQVLKEASVDVLAIAPAGSQ